MSVWTPEPSSHSNRELLKRSDLLHRQGSITASHQGKPFWLPRLKQVHTRYTWSGSLLPESENKRSIAYVFVRSIQVESRQAK